MGRTPGGTASGRHLRLRCARESPVRSLFFFQAEDGIRDLYVTGVQTCALPIWSPCNLALAGRRPPVPRCRSWLLLRPAEDLGPQRVTPPLQARLHRPDGHAQRRRDLVVGEADRKSVV